VAFIRGSRALSAITALYFGACSFLPVPMNEPLRLVPPGNTEYRLLDINRHPRMCRVGEVMVWSLFETTIKN